MYFVSSYLIYSSLSPGLIPLARAFITFLQRILIGNLSQCNSWNGRSVRWYLSNTHYCNFTRTLQSTVYTLLNCACCTEYFTELYLLYTVLYWTVLAVHCTEFYCSFCIKPYSTYCTLYFTLCYPLSFLTLMSSWWTPYCTVGIVATYCTAVLQKLLRGLEC